MHDAVNTLHSFVEGIFFLDVWHNDKRELAPVVFIQIDEIFALVKSNANTRYARDRTKR